MIDSREIYWNVTGGGWVYALALAAGALLAYGVWRRARLWRRGVRQARFDRVGQRLGEVVREVLGQRRLRRVRGAGRAHAALFFGFAGLVVATALIAIQEWSGVVFLRGDFYRVYSLFADSCGVLGLAGLGALGWRRLRARDAAPSDRRSAIESALAIGLLALVFAQGFALEGLRIAVTELEQAPALARWSPAGWAIALALAGIDPGAARALHRALWWAHAVSALGLLAYFPYGRLAHVLFAPLSIAARDLAPSGRLAHPDLEALSDAELESLGTGRIERFGWKDLLDLDACVDCGRCESVCPAHLTGSPLSPRKLVRDLRARLDGSATDAPLVGERAALPAVLDAEVWACRTCGACQRECPVYVEHVPKIVGLRRHLVLAEGNVSEPARALLQSLDERLHAWPGSAGGREDWLEGLEVPLARRDGPRELLLFVGCTGALVARNVAVTRALARVLRAAGVDFFVLGDEEACCGDPARRIGGELTYQTCAKTNRETFERYGVRRIVTACPHCLNTLRNEYPDFGGRYEVIHHSELLAELLRDGRLRPSASLESLTYHDSCYLGRHNGIYDAPREVARALAGDGALRELSAHHCRALCCGAGGGHAWLDERAPARPADLRLEQIAASGAATAAVGCPFCLQMLGDAATGSGAAGFAPRIADLAELLDEALAVDAQNSSG